MNEFRPSYDWNEKLELGIKEMLLSTQVTDRKTIGSIVGVSVMAAGGVILLGITVIGLVVGVAGGLVGGLMGGYFGK
jgi:hypothetical protein